MAKMTKRVLAMCMALLLSISMIAHPAMATEAPVEQPAVTEAPAEEPEATETPAEEPEATEAPAEEPEATEAPATEPKTKASGAQKSSKAIGGNNYNNQYEWYQVYVQGNLVASGKGNGGDMYYLGTHYTTSITSSGSKVTWSIVTHGGRGNKFGGTVDLKDYISIPDGFTVKEYKIDESSVEGVNSAAGSAYFDNAVIKITIKTIYNEQTGEEIELPDPDPVPDPVVTKVTVNHKYITRDVYTGDETVDGTSSNSYNVVEGENFAATAVPEYNGKTYTQRSASPAMSIVVNASAEKNVIDIVYERTIDTTPAATGVTVNHKYMTLDLYTGEETVDGTTTGTFDAYVGETFVAAPVASYEGNIYVRQTGDDALSIVVKANAAENVINIEYQRTIDTTPAATKATVNHKYVTLDLYTGIKTTDGTVSSTFDVTEGDSFTATEVNSFNGKTYEKNAVSPAMSITVQADASANVINIEYLRVIDTTPINYTPVLSITKTADKAVYEFGEVITWTITVKNVSAYTAYDVVINDTVTGDSWTIDELKSGEEASFTATTEDAASGSFKNVATASWTDNDEIDDEDEPNEIKSVTGEAIVSINDPIPENYTPVLTVEKTPDQESYKEGQTVTWTITVKNISQYSAYNVVVVDELAKGYWVIEELAPGAEQSFTATMENVAAGSVKNMVVVNWEDRDEIDDSEETNEITTVSDEAVVTVEELINYTPVLNITKTAAKKTYYVGQTIKWTIKVKNISEHTAHDVVVFDEMTGDIWIISELAPGEEDTFTVKTKAEKTGTVKNAVVVTWNDRDEIDDAKEPDEVNSASDVATTAVKKATAPVIPTDPTDPDPTDPARDEPAAQDDGLEIPDEDVPLASAPKTGDLSTIWLALSGISAAGMILLGKKREDEE